MHIPARDLNRRQLLQRAIAAGGVAVVGTGFIAAPNAAWALEVTTITEHQMATLIQMARDIYPHDKVGDEYYVIAVKGYDSEDSKEVVAQGVAKLDELAQAAGADSYLVTKWEDNRVALLKQIEDDAFFQTVRGGLVTGLYNQKAVWSIFGYEGESYSLGGYIDRGFNDINWL
ncbi:twin-arginine translocation signal domain-containing protein [Sedimentitalea todarodis]|uniref:Twin-arginine translocation signal domain-containing protein n=1 Tax=Sedimentitalea todarodis TaxID=1631240 RepID=A0ABU3VHP2_9RHOB|nr:twin-arginine translocation signal domain-containing protein [Sedimentitalea todarodis]MDU9005608.1 twin-arginine translocation signal domain-containing protein [Sedimentitalea todarodis]